MIILPSVSDMQQVRCRASSFRLDGFRFGYSPPQAATGHSSLFKYYDHTRSRGPYASTSPLIGGLRL